MALGKNPDPTVAASSQHSLILVDAGNTRLKFGHVVLDSADPDQLPECVAFTAVREKGPLPWEEVQSWVNNTGLRVQGVVTGSNPAQIERVVNAWPSQWGPSRIVLDRSALPIAIDVDHPDRVGMDRLLNAVAANVLRDPGQPVIVIDVGTATTVDAVSVDGVFLGGAIIAGPELTARALHEYTAVLPHVTLDELAQSEPAVIGRNTADAIKSGLYWGHWQAIWSYCVRMREPLGIDNVPQIIVTGGAAGLFASRLSPTHTYLPHLTLQGLAVVAGQFNFEKG
jgi:type III pantothenate kinase